LTHKISKDYGVYLDDLGHTLRGLFIIDAKGILRQITMNDLPVGRNVDETLRYDVSLSLILNIQDSIFDSFRLVQAFQYTDTHGEVCPAGWKKGSPTIIPDPENKLKYFEKNT
jgi:peroxiredoxin 2/4